MTLILTVVLAVVAVALATYASTALRTTRVSEDRVDRLAAAESAMQETLIQLGTSGTCPTDLADRNGATVDVEECHPEEVAVTDGNAPFGLILTAHGLSTATDAFVRNGASVQTIDVGGEVYIAEKATGDANNVQATGYVLSQAELCDDIPDPMKAGPTWLGLDQSHCTQDRWTEYTDAPVVPTIAEPSALPSPSGCTRFTPGDVTGDVDASGDVYFASGVYQVTGNLSLSGRITAGHNGTVTLGSNHDCFAVQQADVAQANDTTDPTATGVLFVLEAGGNISVTGNDTLAEMYGLETGNRTLSIVAYPPDYSTDPAIPEGHGAPTGYSASTRNPDQTNQALIRIPNGSPNAAFSFRGEVWAPSGFVQLQQMSSSGAAGAAFQGGATISRFEANTSNDVSGLVIGIGQMITETYHRVRVTATSPDGVTTTVSAVTRQLPDSDLRVQSWRVL